jgi:hypothetical protein
MTYYDLCHIFRGILRLNDVGDDDDDDDDDYHNSLISNI